MDTMNIPLYEAAQVRRLYFYGFSTADISKVVGLTNNEVLEVTDSLIPIKDAD